MNYRHWIPGLCIAVSACGVGAPDYAGAIGRHWSQEQAAQNERAADLGEQAASFEKSAAAASRMARQFGGQGPSSEVAAEHGDEARRLRGEEADARYIASSSLQGVRNVSCAPAAPDPGQNCAVTLTIKGKDGAVHDVPAKWRFDTVDGRLSVVSGT